MNRDNNQFTVSEKFLLGQLDDKECALILKSLVNDKGLQRKLYEESSFEAAFSSQQWLESNSSIKDNLSHWLSSDPSVLPPAKKEMINKECDERLYTDNKWEKLIEKSYMQARAQWKPSFFLPFSFKKLRVYISLLIILILSGMLWLNTIKPQIAKNSTKDNVVVHTSKSNKQIESVYVDSLDQTQTSIEEPISVYDTINEFYAEKTTKSNISLPPKEKGIIYLSKNSGFLAEKGADVKIITNTDSVVMLSMTRGSAVFTVEKNTYKRFAVITPYAEVRVVGTIFQVSVYPKKTDVKVVEGTVTITTIQGTQETLTLTKGKTVYISEDSLVQDVIRRSRMLKKRENLLKSYLKYIHTSRIDQFPVKYLINELQVKEQSVIDSLADVFDPVVRAQLMHYRVAGNYEKEHRYEKAKNYLLQMYRERQVALFAQLALLHICQLEIQHFQRDKALEYMETYIDEFAGGFALEEVLMLHVQTCLAENEYDRTIPYMVQFVQDYKESDFADYIAFYLAQTFRMQKKDLSSAMKYYEYITTNFPESSFHENALYWAGWCLVQERVHGNKNKYFKKYQKDYPDGNWRDVISNKK